MTLTGTIARLLPDKGFGFVRTDSDVEYFFHRTAVVDARFEELHEGLAVTFDEGASSKGPRAEHVRRLTQSGVHTKGAT